MNEQIKQAIKKGELVLLLGAGATMSSKDQYGEKLMSGPELAGYLSEKAGMVYSDESLQIVYSAVKQTLGSRLNDILEDKYRHCLPSDDLISLAVFPWPRIYTINIDDAFDNALRRNSTQQIEVHHLRDNVKDQDILFKRLDYIKLNGSADNLKDGCIFSPREYGESSANATKWYQELGEDYFRYTFLFIGTKLEEPLFHHQIERHRIESSSQIGKSYLIGGALSEIQVAGLLDLNIHNLDCLLSDFVEWLDEEFPDGLAQIEVAQNANPHLRGLLEADKKDIKARLEPLTSVRLISRKYLTDMSEKKESLKIRDFYRGFPPNWTDILDGVPANLKAIKEFKELSLISIAGDTQIVVCYGPAGSGKTTLLKMTALQLADETEFPIYFYESSKGRIGDVLGELERSNSGRYLFFIDNVDTVASEVEGFIAGGTLKKGLVIAGERHNIWKRRVYEHFIDFKLKEYNLHIINDQDAYEILEKLEKYGSWTRLAKMTPKNRIRELTDKAKSQLLIGLLETTYGIGFEKIILDDYESISDPDEKALLLVAGLATANRVYISTLLASRALRYLNVKRDVSLIVSNLPGIVHISNNKIIARHPVYADRLFELVIDMESIANGVKAILHAFTFYKPPVVTAVERDAFILYRSVLNHKFLRRMLRGDEGRIINIYEAYEKAFERDGLFWLQYGLALRDFNRQREALEKIQISYEAYPSNHAEHALCQQELIMALESPSKAYAYECLDRAKARLMKLDSQMELKDEYPIVTLSEAHTQIVKQFEGDDAARKVAGRYANELFSRLKETKYNQRMEEAWKKLTTYASGSEWEFRKEEFYI